MRVLFASVEVSPFAKVGGLADVAGSLPKALRAVGVDARIVMPAYGMVVQGKAPIKRGVKVPVNDHWSPSMDVWQEDLDGVPVYLIGHPGSFESTTRSEELYQYGRDEYLFFAAGVLALCEILDWIPDVVHANDWHTGFVPVMLREKAGRSWNGTASLFTIHNLQYQGVFGMDTLQSAGLPESLFTSDKLENWGGVNFLKSACVYSDRVNTVSPTYAQEIMTPEFGVGQWGLMQDLDRLGKLSGIVNGIDLDHFNPETDPAIAASFSAHSPTGKTRCKQALQEEFNLPVSAEIPVLGIVSRLSDQKGFDLIFRQAVAMLSLPTQFIALGTGDPAAARELRLLEEEWPDRVRFVERYDGPLAQRIYAGSDIFLMPSAFEPCGLGQMIACRYGTLPLVRRTGGLADTILDGHNGFVMEHRSARELFETIRKAVGEFRNADLWSERVRCAMRSDFSWNGSAGAYRDLYAAAIADRRGSAIIGH